jgi:RHS repeat-associated protein
MRFFWVTRAAKIACSVTLAVAIVLPGGVAVPSAPALASPEARAAGLQPRPDAVPGATPALAVRESRDGTRASIVDTRLLPTVNSGDQTGAGPWQGGGGDDLCFGGDFTTTVTAGYWNGKPPDHNLIGSYPATIEFQLSNITPVTNDPSCQGTPSPSVTWSTSWGPVVEGTNVSVPITYDEAVAAITPYDVWPCASAWIDCLPYDITASDGLGHTYDFGWQPVYVAASGDPVAGGPTIAEQGGPPNPSENPTVCSGSDPVNCATGEFWSQAPDIRVPGRGMPLELTRSYASGAAGAKGPFGYGWTGSYAMSLAKNQYGQVIVTQEDGSAVAFTPANGQLTAQGKVLATLVQDQDGSYVFTRDRGGTQYRFSPAGQLAGEVDRNGYATLLAYDSQGRLASVTDPAGRKVTFGYSGSLITSATGPTGRTWTYSYDAAGNLTMATDPIGRAWSYSYDAEHRLLTTTDPRGGVTSNAYDSAGRVTAQTDPAGHTTTWAYTGNPRGVDGGTTTQTAPSGSITRYQYADLELQSVTRGYGTPAAATTSYTYDPGTLGVKTVTDPDGNVTSNSYDGSGNPEISTDGLGNSTTYTYNKLNEVLTRTDPLGDTTSYSYDAHGNLLSVTGPLGDATTYKYADTAHPGDITSVTDPDRAVISYTYDAYGDVASASVSPSAGVTNTTEFAYDADGERTCAASPDAVAAGVTCPAAGTTRTTYDADGEVTSVTDPDGHLTRYSYDAGGDRISVTSPAGQVTGYAYNGDGEQVKVTQPGGTVQLTGYDADGNVTSQVNAVGDVTKYAYDALGLVVSMTDPLGHLTRYGYDPAGNRVTLTSAEGQITSYAYDADGRPTGITYSDGKTPAVSYAYDADGRRTSMTDGTGTTTYTYDADSHLTSVTDGAGATVSYGFDPAGLLTAITYPNGQQVTRGYDGAGELTSVSDWLGNTTAFGYDRDGNLTSEAYPNGVRALLGYDAAGELLSVTDTKTKAFLASFSYARNSLGEITADTEAGAATGTQDYSYTQLSQLASDSTGKYGYDSAGDLAAQPGGQAQAFNADGQVTATTVPAPVKAPAATAVVSASQLTSGASVTSPALTTKASGELVIAFISASGPAGRPQQVTSVSGGGLAWRPAARADGQQGTAEAWQSYAAKPLSKVKITAALQYKGHDAAITVAAFTGARTAVGAHATASRTSGTPAATVTTTGPDSLVWAVGEDPSRATARRPAAGQSLAYQDLDVHGKATFWVQRTAAIARAGTAVKAADTIPAGDKWDLAAVEILAAVPTVTTSYAYDQDGNRTRAGSVGLAYNQAGDLTSYGTAAAYGYNGDGLRMSKTAGGTTTAFTWDQSGSLPLLIAAGSTYYLYGPDGRPIEQVTGTTPGYLLSDQSGSTRLITSATGAVTGIYAYSPYGTVTRHTGSTTTALQYDGQYTDSESGLQYLQARYYDPVTGQFTSTDPLNSLTQEPYGYANQDPIDDSDPTGLYSYTYNQYIGSVSDTGGAKPVMAYLQRNLGALFPFGTGKCSSVTLNARCVLTPYWMTDPVDITGVTCTSFTFTTPAGNTSLGAGGTITFSTFVYQGNVYLQESADNPDASWLSIWAVNLQLVRLTWWKLGQNLSAHYENQHPSFGGGGDAGDGGGAGR